jgi:hypothetical protein
MLGRTPMAAEKPVRCPACGGVPGVFATYTTWRVQCVSHMLLCWSGPERRTERGAIAVWNKVMGGKHG